MLFEVTERCQWEKNKKIWNNILNNEPAANAKLNGTKRNDTERQCLWPI